MAMSSRHLVLAMLSFAPGESAKALGLNSALFSNTRLESEGMRFAVPRWSRGWCNIITRLLVTLGFYFCVFVSTCWLQTWWLLQLFALATQPIHVIVLHCLH
mmetsp:Transcript_55875/g.130800  ORF Transcript_55875/g.130800 Transcript_55875/m.130800 type:complete len:102 (-) Transcript_55875:120-425(-)